MEKVYITKVNKGQENTHSIGAFDSSSKQLIVPFTSKKGMSVVEIVKVDYVTAIENGWRLEVLVVVDDRHYLNTYFATKLDKKEVK